MTDASTARGSFAGGDVALIGCGYWGRNLLRNLNALGALGAVSDLDPATLEAAVAATGCAPMSLEEVLASDEIRAVAIATPAATHAEIAMQALEAGKHVFVEKPLALDVADAEAVCALAADRGLIVMVGHLLQYHPSFLRLRQLVDAGELGRLQYIYSNRVNLGKIRREENIWWSFAPHDISMILALTGQEPDGVDATGSFFLHDAIADVTTTQLTFPNGQRAHIFVSWLHPMKEQRLVVIGDRGMAVFDDGQAWAEKLVVYRHAVQWVDGQPQPTRAEAEPVSVEEREPLLDECQHFLDCIRTGAQPRTDGLEGLRVLRVLSAAEESMREKRAHPRGAGRSDGELRVPALEAPALVHESAYVDDGVSIGTGTRVWHFSHVLAGSVIGEGCNIGQNVVIGPDVTIGDRCRIQNNVSVYKGVTLEDGVFCGPSCVFTNVNNPRAEISRADEFRPTLVRRGATIGANATIVCGHEIGSYAFIAAGAVVTDDVPPHALMVGVPARRRGWMSHDGEQLDTQLRCPRSGRQYELDEAGALREVGLSQEESQP